MKSENIKILAIETSCDETAAAVIGVKDGQPVILSNVVSSQIDLHAKTGGVVPEVASRAHLEAIIPVITEALLVAKNFNIQQPTPNQIPNCKNQMEIKNWMLNGRWNLEVGNSKNFLLEDITHIAVTAGPGLIGSLLVGYNAAKTIAYAKNLPIIPINHIEGHIYSAFAELGQKPKVKSQKPGTIFPILALTVSGGHTSLTLMKGHGQYETIGQTLDDAVGEAYDKVARLLDLGYPGGPKIAQLAQQFRDKFLNKSKNSYGNEATNQLNNKIIFPRPILNDGTYNFSLSGLKTAVLVKVKNIMTQFGYATPDQIPENTKEEIAFAFEEAVAEVLSVKTAKAAIQYRANAVIFAGGVSANTYLGERIKDELAKTNTELPICIPKRELAGDNAAMIGIAAYYHILDGKVRKWDDTKVDSGWELA